MNWDMTLWLPEALLNERLQIRKLFQFCPRGNFFRIHFHGVFQFNSKGRAHILVCKNVKWNNIQRSGDSGSPGRKKDLSLFAQSIHGQLWFRHLTVEDVTEKWHVWISIRLFSIVLLTFGIDYAFSGQLFLVVNCRKVSWLEYEGAHILKVYQQLARRDQCQNSFWNQSHGAMIQLIFFSQCHKTPRNKVIPNNQRKRHKKRYWTSAYFKTIEPA